MNSQPKWDIYESVVLLNGKAMGEFLHDFEEGQLLTCAEAIGIPDVKKQIGSGEATWLWNMDTGLEELRKLLVDYKIILQSTQLGIKSASFFSCMQAWKEYTRYIKSPASVITAKCPELMYFIGCLKDIAEMERFLMKNMRNSLQNSLKKLLSFPH